jgi:hypothetical protein
MGTVSRRDRAMVVDDDAADHADERGFFNGALRVSCVVTDGG